MDIGTNTHFEGNINASHVYALSSGALVTTPLLLTREQYVKFTMRPGDEIDIQSPHAGPGHIRCRILDIESVHAEPGHVYIRLTMEKVVSGKW
ncbi:MAG TPA: hypothetical protein VIH22_00250 [Cyclobacteriaceae bacterium]